MGVSSKLSIESLNVLAEKRGGKLLSRSYKNRHQKLKWQCSKGHEWNASAASIKGLGSWCPFCAGVAKKTINDMRKIAASKGGVCLSKKYFNSRTKLKWQCSRGHVWEAAPSHIASTWCPKCSGNKKYSIDYMNELAEVRGGKCLSKNYINNKHKLRWQCKKGHAWHKSPHHILRGQWCIKCTLDKKLEEYKNIAIKKGGECISNEYISSSKDLKWRCAENHTFTMTPGSVKKGSWCPRCSRYMSEEICRYTFEELFNVRFSKKRPKWLNESSGHNLELDGYNKRLNLAFEYQGEQHYKPVKWSKSVSNDDAKEKLKIQKKYDNLKRNACKKNGVHLIVITYKNNLLNLPKLIKQKCEKFKLDIGKINFDKKIDLNKIYFVKNNLKIFQDIAKRNGGKCLSKVYLNSRTKLKFECSEGHVWETRPGVVKAGGWCNICSNKRKIKGDISLMQEVAKSRGGKCLSKKYVRSHEKLIWECAYGHKWEAPYSRIKAGSWCRVCQYKNMRKNNE